MAAQGDPRRKRREEALYKRIDRKEKRKLWARRHKEESMWFGLGMMGLIGWSVAIPILAGLALGLWLDATVPGRFSWTLTLLAAGVLAGCWNAWYWVTREQELIARLEEELKEELREEALQESEEEAGG